MWDYRILEHKIENDDRIYYSLVECFYDEGGRPNGHTGPINFGYYEMPDEIRNSLTMAIRDVMKKPVLKEEEVYKNHPWEKSVAEQEWRDALADEEEAELMEWEPPYTPPTPLPSVQFPKGEARDGPGSGSPF
jgi:hypothetical protein